MARGKRPTDSLGPAHRDTVPLTPAVGQILNDRYEIIEQLGHGAHGVVFRARDRIAAEAVALKVLVLDPRHPARLDWLRRELRAARKIAHPNVVRIHDLVDLGSGQIALSMELVAGETLESRLERGPLSPSEWTTLTYALAAALVAARDAGVMHRDLKPANVLLREADGQPVISDFGVSRILDTATPIESASTLGPAEVGLSADGALVGTPLYMAPEQLAGKPITPEADVYSLGVLLFEAAIGKRPHSGTSVDEIAAARSTPPPGLALQRGDLPPDLCATVDRMLEYLPERRPDLRELVPRGSARRGADSRRRLVLALAAAGIVTWVAVIAVWAPWRSKAPKGPYRVAVTLHLDDADRALERTVAVLATRVLLTEPRIDVAERTETDAVIVLDVHRTSDGASLVGRIEASDGSIEQVDVSAGSVAQGLGRVLSKVAPRAADAGIRPASQLEIEQMQLLGATSLEAYRQYAANERALFSTVSIDPTEVEKVQAGLLRIDPAWPHAYVSLAIIRGVFSSGAEDAVSQARASADHARDPRGWKILEAIELQNRGKSGEARETLAAITDPHDLVGSWVMLNALYFIDDVDAQMALSRRLYEVWPQRQFGYDLMTLLDQTGRGAEVPALIAQWLDRDPANEQALASRAKLSVNSGKWADAQRDACDLLFLFGDQPHRLILFCDVMILAGRGDDAHALIDRLTAGDQYTRPHGLYRQGVLATLEGRFGAAYETLKEAYAANLPLGANGETTQALDALRGLAWLGGRAESEHWIEEQVKVHESHGATADAAVARFELALLRREPAVACPDPDAAAAAVPAGRQQARARIEMRRAAAAAGCATCKSVVEGGMSLRETSPRSLLAFAACAESEGEIDLAARAYEQIVDRRAVYGIGVGIDAPFEWMIATYRRAVLAERTGDRARARAGYQQVLARWGTPDRPVAEVTKARQALASLGEP